MENRMGSSWSGTLIWRMWMSAVPGFKRDEFADDLEQATAAGDHLLHASDSGSVPPRPRDRFRSRTLPIEQGLDDVHASRLIETGGYSNRFPPRNRPDGSGSVAGALTHPGFSACDRLPKDGNP